MALHGALPVPARIPIGKLRFGADRGGVEEHLSPAEDKTPCGFGKPLVPADAEADFAELGVPDPEAGVAGIEVIFFLIPDAVRNVRLAVDAEQLAARIDHRDRIEIRLVVALEKAERQNDIQLAGQLLESGDASVTLDRAG